MKKVIIESGAKQYLVSVGDHLAVELLSEDKKDIVFYPLLLIDGERIQVGKPHLETVSVKARVIEEMREDKVTSIRFKAKKRVHKRRGHRQKKTIIEIVAIA